MLINNTHKKSAPSPEIEVIPDVGHEPEIVPVDRVQVGVVRRRQVHLERDAGPLRNDGHYLQLKASHVPTADNGTVVEPQSQPATGATTIAGAVHDVISHGGYVQLATAEEAGIPGGGMRGGSGHVICGLGIRSNGGEEGVGKEVISC